MPTPSTTSASCTPTAEGVPQDYAEAVKWYRLAAEQGDAGAQFSLGLMYASGRGRAAGRSLLAHMWFNLVGGSGQRGGKTNRDVAAAR